MSEVKRPTRPTACIPYGLNYETHPNASFYYRAQAADAYMDKLEAENRDRRAEAHRLIDEMTKLEAENRKLREAIAVHRRDLWEPGPVDHYADRNLYAVLEEATHE